MRVVPDNNVLDRVERLVTELRAIEHWDVGHWRKNCPEVHEILAFTARQRRREEILSQLVRLVGRFENENRRTCIG
jgi:hypothetical protein